MATTDIQVQISTGRRRQAEALAAKISETLVLRGLEDTIRDVWIAHDPQSGQDWLICVHDMRVMNKLEAYQTEEVLHHLSTAIKGLPVLVSNHSGLRYFVPLTAIRKLARQVDFPGVERGYVLVGQNYSGQSVRVRWDPMGHVMAAGMTGSGKSSYLRNLAYQGIAEGCQLFLADRDGTTFPMLAQQPQLAAPIATEPPEVLGLVQQALGECDHRATLYQQLGTFPDNLEEYNAGAVKAGLSVLPRLLVILDEYNATVTGAGGVNGPLSKAAAALGWRGRKFGVNLVFAAQAFSKDIVGHVRDQISTAIVFRVRNANIARALDCAQAAHISPQRPGLAYTDRWGLVQTYYLDKATLVAAGQTTPAPALTSEEQVIVQRALAETEGRLTQSLLEESGWTEWQSRKLLRDWELRGWVKKDPARDNARYITPKLRVLLSNHPTAQTPSNPPSVSQTASSRAQTTKENY